MTNTPTLQRKYKPWLQCQDYTKLNTKTDPTAVRGHKTYTYATKNLEQVEHGIFRTEKKKKKGTAKHV